jgi:hypothetical protein
MMLVTLGALAMWVVLSFMYLGSCDGRSVWSGAVPPEGLSQPIELREGSTLEVDAYAELNNQWLYLDVVLVGPTDVSEEARWDGIEVERWSGPDWSEGSRDGAALLAGMPAGRYVLQVTPDPQSTYKGPARLAVREDVPMWRYLACSLAFLLVIPVVVTLQSASFEGRRWAESDHA